MSGYKRYPAYRESGVEWIGEIPAGWSHKMLKFVGNAVLGKMLTNDDKGDYSLKPYLRAKNILWEKVDASDINEMWFSGREMEQFRVQKDDLLISEGGEVGRTAIWNDELEECYLQNSVHKFTVGNGEEPRFHLYQLVTLGKLGYFDSVVNKVSIGHLTGEKLGPVPLVCPPTKEQTKIAAFLDRKTAQIDRLIEIKRRQIELLKEERTAVINHVVTKGLNPEAKMKESGIEWIGEIPEGWEIVELRRVAESLQTGPFGSQLHAEEYVSNGVPVINPSHLKNGRILPDFEVSVDEDTANNLSRHFLEIGDIVFARRGELGRCGLVTETEKGWLCGTGSLRFRPNQKQIHSDFLSWYLTTRYVGDWLSLQSVGSTMENLNTEILGRVPVPLVPLEEQIKISTKLSVITQEIAETINQAEKQIQLLQEYRTTLISDAVTGKIDVREEAA